MPGIALPEEILQIIWRKVYSNNVLSYLNIHSYTTVDYVYLDMNERRIFANLKQ